MFSDSFPALISRVFARVEVRTSLSCPVREKMRKLPKPAAVALVRKQCFVRELPCHYNRRGEVESARVRRVHAPERFLERLQSAGNRRRAEVHVLAVRFDAGHEPELVNIQVPEPLAQREGGLSALVRQFTVLADSSQ